MATSLDFKALLAEERAKLQRQRGDSRGEGESSGGDGSEVVVLGPRAPLEWERHAVPGPVEGVFYVEDWLTEQEAASLLSAIDRAPPSAWTNLHNRRLQNLGGVPDSVGGMHPVPVPGYASAVFLALVQAGIFEPDAPPNHVLLNDYARGQGIAPHKDGPLYQDTVAIVSLGTPARLDFWEASDPTQAAALPPRASVHLAPRSLLVFRGAAYRDFFHGILRREPSAATADPLDDRRVSLTVRRVLRVREGAERLETSEQRREEKRKEARFLMSITDDRPDLSS